MSNGPLRKSAITATLVLAMMFLAGLGSGTLLARWPAPETSVRNDYFRVVLDSLSISAEQRSLLDSILAERTARTNVILEEAVSRLEAMVDSTTLDLRAALDGDQAIEFDRLVNRERSAQPTRRRAPSGS